MIDFLLGTNHINIAYLGIFMTAVGMITLAFYSIPRSTSEMFKKRNVRGVRISMPFIMSSGLLVMFVAWFGAFYRIFIAQSIGSASSNNMVGFYGIALAILSIGFFIVYRFGGDGEDL